MLREPSRLLPRDRLEGDDGAGQLGRGEAPAGVVEQPARQLELIGRGAAPAQGGDAVDLRRQLRRDHDEEGLRQRCRLDAAGPPPRPVAEALARARDILHRRHAVWVDRLAEG